VLGVIASGENTVVGAGDLSTVRFEFGLELLGGVDKTEAFDRDLGLAGFGD